MRRLGSITLMGALLAVLVSWPLSYSHRHGFHITLAHKYGLWCEYGFVEFRYGTHTEVTWDKSGQPSLILVPYNTPWQAPPGHTTGSTPWNRYSPSFGLSPWRPFQTADYLRGGEFPVVARDRSVRYQEFGETITVVATPHWFLMLLFAVPLSAAIALHRYRTLPSVRLAKGLCPTCGYDLRASNERCPECGAIIPLAIENQNSKI
jgi:hypothetical protein